MTYVAPTSLLSRGLSAALSVVIPAAIGAALLFSAVAGAPDRGARAGERGTVLVVELLPLDTAGVPAQGGLRRNAVQSKATGVTDASGGRPDPRERRPDQHVGSTPPGEGGTADTSGEGHTPDQQNGTPTPSGAQIQAFRDTLLRHIERFRHYPASARASAAQGIVRIQFVMDRNGDVTQAWIEQGSGAAMLDEEAIAAVMRARPLPVPPSDWPQTFAVSLPIEFALR